MLGTAWCGPRPPSRPASRNAFARNPAKPFRTKPPHPLTDGDRSSPRVHLVNATGSDGPGGGEVGRTGSVADGKVDGHPCAAEAGVVVGGDPPAVRLDVRSDDGEPEAGAGGAARVRSRLVGLREPLK